MKFDAEHILWYFNAVCTVIVLSRFLILRLARQYPLFCAYIAFSLARSTALILVTLTGGDINSSAYELAWTISEPFIISLQIAFIVEVCNSVYQRYAGLGATGQRAIHWASILAAVGCLLTITADLRSSHWVPSIGLLLTLKRTVTTIGAGTTALLVLGMFMVPVRMAANLKTHTKLVMVYLAVSAIGYRAINVSWASRGAWMITIMAASSMLFLIWAVRMTRAGEIVPELDPNYSDPTLDEDWEQLKAVARTAPKPFRLS